MSYVVWRVADTLAKQNLPNILGNLAANVHVLAVGRIQLLAKLSKVEPASTAVNKWCNSSIVLAMLIIPVKSIAKFTNAIIRHTNSSPGAESCRQSRDGSPAGQWARPVHAVREEGTAHKPTCSYFRIRVRRNTRQVERLREANQTREHQQHEGRHDLCDNWGTMQAS